MSRRVVVTGIGGVSPLGIAADKNRDALIQGTCGIGSITSFSCAGFPARSAGEIRTFQPALFGIKPKSLKVMNKTIQYAVAATFLALQDARMQDAGYGPREIGLVMGVHGVQFSATDLLLASCEAMAGDMRGYMSAAYKTAGTAVTIKDPSRTVHPLWALSVLANMSLCHIAIQHNIQGPNLALSSLDAAGAQAIGEAVHLIRDGAADICIAGGSYALNTNDFLSLSSLGMLAYDAEYFRPFDSSSTGCVLGEGSAVLVLEERSRALNRNAPVHAEIAGFSSIVNGGTGASDIAASPPDRQGMADCLSRALQDASVAPAAIDYIHADGKGTPDADRMESFAIRDVFGEASGRIPLSTTKPLTGHMLSASGAFGALATVLAVRDGFMPPIRKYTAPEDTFPLNIVAKAAIRKKMRHAVSMTFGITGEHTALVMRAPA